MVMEKLNQMKMKRNENTFIPLNYPLIRRIQWWRKKSMNDDKGGSFNVELYLQYCKIKFEQV
jgi:hypothetical protein